MSDAQDEHRRHHGSHGHPKDDDRDHKHRRKKQQEKRDPKQVHIFDSL